MTKLYGETCVKLSLDLQRQQEKERSLYSDSQRKQTNYTEKPDTHQVQTIGGRQPRCKQ